MLRLGLGVTAAVAMVATGAIAAANGGSISTVAGTGRYGFSGDGGPARAARFKSPWDVALDAKGNVYVIDLESLRVREITRAGRIRTIAGTGKCCTHLGDGGPAKAAQMGPVGLAVDAKGNVYISDVRYNRVRKVSPNGTIRTVAGNGKEGFSGDGGRATAARLSTPQGIDVDARGNLYIADLGNSRVRRVSPNGIIRTIAGNGQRGSTGNGGPAVAARLSEPEDVAVDSRGNVYIASVSLSGAHESSGLPSEVRKVSPNGTITVFAGTGVEGFSGDGGPAVAAQLKDPKGMAVDQRGNVYIADSSNMRVRMVAPDGTIATFAGNGDFVFSGDGGPATAAGIAYPSGVAVDRAGNVYITDSGNYRVRKVSP